MKIAHIGLAAYYTEGMTYQDNQLAHQNALDGHEVLYISNAKKYVNGVIVDTGYEDLVCENGVRLLRIPFQKIGGRVFTEKVRKIKGLYEILNDFQPDVILSHSLGYVSVCDVIKYKKEHPNVRFYADTHAATYNSSTTLISRFVLHGCFYRFLMQKTIPYMERLFYIGEAERQFAKACYGAPDNILEFYPLGGNVFSDEEYKDIREKRRSELGITENIRLYSHAGKLTDIKRTELLIEAFSKTADDNAMLIIMGSIPDDRKPILLPLIENDSRIKYLGWVDGITLQEYLCASDLYCQPYDTSSIFQNAICCRCPVMTYPHEYYVSLYDSGNILWEKDENDMRNVFEQIKEGKIYLGDLSEKSKVFAEEKLDYRKLAARLYE